MNNELNGAYLEDFNIIKKYVEKHCQRGTDRDEALQSLRAIYLDAQEGAAALEEIRGESAEDYAKEIAAALPKKKWLKFSPFLKIAAVVVLSLSVGAAVIWITSDVYAVKTRGYAFVLENPEKFTVKTEWLNPSDISNYLYCGPNGIEKQRGYCDFIGMTFKSVDFDNYEKKLTFGVTTDSVTSTKTNVTQIITPNIPVYDKENRLLYMKNHGVNVKIGEKIFPGTVENFRVSRGGDICFDLTFTFDDETNFSDISEYVNSGKVVIIQYERLYEVSYSYIGMWLAQQASGCSSFFNSPFGAAVNYPEPLYDFVFYNFETKSGLKISASLVIDRETKKFVIIDNILVGEASDFISSIGRYTDYIDENGDVHIPYSYILKSSNKKIRDEIVVSYCNK